MKNMTFIIKNFAFTLIFLINSTNSNISLGTCSLSCNENENSSNGMLKNRSIRGIAGPAGKTGPRGMVGSFGDRGLKGEPGVCDRNDNQDVIDEVDSLKSEIKALQRNIFIKDCKQAKEVISSSGVNVIFPFQSVTKGIHVYCEQYTDGGGWIVIQRRVGGLVDFFRGWDEYVTGFGNKEADFWLGLENIYLLAKTGSHELRVDLEDDSGNRAFAKYSSFRLGSVEENYTLHVGGYSGDAGDSLMPHNKMAFTTKDKENDIQERVNCAIHHTGAWWYHGCHSSNLNGAYGGSVSGANGVSWFSWKNTHESLKAVEMKIR